MNFEAGNEKHTKIEVVWVLNRIEEWRKRSGFFVYTAVFEKLRTNSAIELNFLFMCGF